MKKAIIAIVVVLVIAGGAYAIFHKSSKPSSANSPQTSSQSSGQPVNNAVVITKTNSSVGQYLADPNGNSLYTYNADSNGVSNCTGSCLAAWPPYIDKGSTTNLPAGISTIKRTDNGDIQYTYNGLPLYYFASDSQGQVTGNGVQNFTVAKPAAASSTPSSSPSSSSTSTPAQTNNSSSSSGYPY